MYSAAVKGKDFIMTNIINPLFVKSNSKPNEVLSGVKETNIPVSPANGKPMVKMYCHDIPVYVDLEHRFVLPIKKDDK